MNENENEKENAFDFEICLVYTLVLFVHRFCYFFSSHQVFYLLTDSLIVFISILFFFLHDHFYLVCFHLIYIYR